MQNITDNSRAQIPSSVAPAAISLPSDFIRLDWIPMGPPRLRPPAALSAEQRGMWINLFWAMFDAELQGYLVVTSDMWSVAGARDRQRWESQRARVTASFIDADIAGRHVIFFPALIEALEAQRPKLLAKKRRAGFSKPANASESGGDSHSLHSNSQAHDAPSLSPQSDFAFDLGSLIQIQKQSSTRAPARARAGANTQSGYTQADFDARDLRKMASAWEKLMVRDSTGRAAGSSMSQRRMFEFVCETAGVTIERGLELEELRKKWPEKVPDWLKEIPADTPKSRSEPGNQEVWSLGARRRPNNRAEQRQEDNLAANAACKQRLRERFGSD